MVKYSEVQEFMDRCAAEILYDILRGQFPEFTVYLDKPLVTGGVWFIDMLFKNRHISVAWKFDKGFGLVHREDHGYGEGADEVYDSVEEVANRIKELLIEGYGL